MAGNTPFLVTSGHSCAYPAEMAGLSFSNRGQACMWASVLIDALPFRQSRAARREAQAATGPLDFDIFPLSDSNHLANTIYHPPGQR